jgi:hypothetical protein
MLPRSVKAASWLGGLALCGFMTSRLAMHESPELSRSLPRAAHPLSAAVHFAAPAPPRPATSEPGSPHEALLPTASRHTAAQAVEEIETLVRLGKIGRARGRAREYYERFPDDPFVTHIEQLTGLHPQPSGPATK